jgi:hypothetical protein
VVPRFIKGLRDTGKKISDVFSYDDIREGYNKAILNYPPTLHAKITEAVNNYGPFLGLMDTNKYLLDALNPFLYDEDSAQTAHDFLKDLTKAYNEFVSSCWELRRDCCIEDYEFERHLMLGAIQRTPTFDSVNPINNDLYRNYFLSTAITPEQERRFRKAAWMYDRMLVMVKSFIQFKYSGEPLPSDADNFLVPSKESDYPLGAGAIPEYYQPLVKAPYTLPQVWNPDLTLRQKSEEVLSLNPGIYTTRPETLAPFNFNIDPYPFFKTAILLGRPWQSVIDGFNRMSEKYSLPIKAIALHLNGDVELSPEELECHFGYMQEDYLQTRSEMAVLLSNVGSLGSLGLDLATLSSGFTLPADFLTYYPGVYTDLLLALTPGTIYEFCSGKPFKDGSEVFGYETWADWFGYLYNEMLDGLLYIRMMLQHTLDQNFRLIPDTCSTPDYLQKLSELERLIDTVDDALDSGLFASLVALCGSYRFKLNYLINGNPTLFSNFVRRHPAVERVGGVPRGGTIIVVYENESTAEGRNIVADFSLPYICCDDCESPLPPLDKSAPFRLSPFARPDMYVTGPGTTLDLFVKVRDIDPGYGYVPSNSLFIIRNAFIESDPVGAPGTSVLIAGADSDYLKFTADSFKPAQPYFVRISYTLQNTETGLTSDSSALVMVRSPFKAVVKAIDDFRVAETCNKLTIDVLANDCVAAEGATLGFELADGTLAGSILTSLSATAEVILTGSAGTYPEIIYYPASPGTDVITYTVISAEGVASKADLTIEVLESCCCCEDLYRTVKAGTTLSFDFFSDFLKKSGTNKVGMPAPAMPMDQEVYYKDLIALGDAGNRPGMTDLAMPFADITSVGASTFSAVIDTDGLFSVTPAASFSGNLYIPYKLTFFEGHKTCIGIIVITVSCDCAGGGAPCLVEDTASGFDILLSVKDILTADEIAKNAQVRFNYTGIPSMSYPPLAGSFSYLGIGDDSAGNFNATFKYKLLPTTVDFFEWPFFVVTVASDGTILTTERSCTLRLNVASVVAPCVVTRIVPGDTVSPLFGILSSSDVSMGRELRFKGDAPLYLPVTSMPAPFPPGAKNITLAPDPGAGGINTGFMIDPNLGFLGTIPFPYYVVEIVAGATTIVKECTMMVEVAAAGSFKLGTVVTKSSFYDTGIPAVGESSDLLTKLDVMSADPADAEKMTEGGMDGDLVTMFITPLKLVRDEIATSSFSAKKRAFYELIFSKLVTATFRLANMQPKLTAKSPLIGLLTDEFTIISDLISLGAIDKSSSVIVVNAKLLTPEPSHKVLASSLTSLLKSL